MALQAGVVGPTRTDVSQQGIQNLTQNMNQVAQLGMQKQVLNEQQRQYNVDQFTKTMLNGQDIATLLMNPEGMNVAKPFIGQLTGMQGRQLDQYLNNLVLSPRSPATMIEMDKMAKMLNMVDQEETPGAMPSQLRLAKEATFRFLGKGQEQSGPVVDVPQGDRTPAPAPGVLPAQPTKSVAGVNLAQPESGQLTGAGYKAVFSPVMNGYVLLDSQNRRVQPNQIPGGFATAEEALKNLDDALRTNTLQRLDDKVFDISQAKQVVEHPATAVLKMNEAELKAVIADPEADGRVKDAAQARLSGTTTGAAAPKQIITNETKPATSAAQGQASSDPNSVEYKRGLMTWIYDNRDKLGAKISTDPRGWSEDTVNKTAAGNMGGGWEAQYKAAQGQGASTISKTPSQAAAQVGQQTLDKDDELLARAYLTKYDPETLQSRGLKPVTPQEQRQADAILVKRQQALQGESRKMWVKNPQLKGVFAKLADRSAFQLQDVAPDARPEDHPYLSALYTNWDGLKARQAEATIRKDLAEAGMKEVETKYYVQKLKADVMKDEINMLLRQDEFAKAALEQGVELMKTTHAETFKTISAITDPAKKEKAFANLMESDPVFKSLWNTVTNGLSYASGNPLSQDRLQAARGGFLGLFEEITNVGVPTIESVGSGPASATGESGYAAEAAAYLNQTKP